MLHPVTPTRPAARPTTDQRPRPLRVLVVSGLNFLGGGELALLRLLPGFPPDHYAVRAAVLAAAGGDLAPAVRATGTEVTEIRMGRGRQVGRTISAVRQLARLAGAADLLHANDVRAALWCQLAALATRRPWVWHVRDLVSGSHRYERAARWVRPTRLIAISSAVKRQALAFGGWPADRIDVVLHGVDVEGLRAQADGPAWRREMGLGPGELAVGIVGRLEPWKGQEDFIRAAALVAPKVPRARFFVVGGVVTDRYTAARLGDEGTRLRRLGADLGLGERLTFTGVRTDIPSVMAGLDVLVLASHAEPFGLVLLEAMSQGTAVVATAAGGAEEVVVPGQTGLLVPPRSPADLAAAIERLLLDPDFRGACGRAGLERVRAAFTLEREVAAVCAVWERAVGARGARRAP